MNESNRIVGIGYNGMPIGCSDDIFPWGRDSDDILERKYLYGWYKEDFLSCIFGGQYLPETIILWLAFAVMILK